MSTLTLALKGEYFDEIKAGRKLEEYRLITPYWQKRLEGRSYQVVELTRGYPRSDDETKRLRLPWRGFRLKTITHPHFGPDPVEVFAIDVSAPVKPGADWSSAPADATHVIRRPGSERASWVKIAGPREAYWRWSTQKNWFISSDSPEKLLAHPYIERRPSAEKLHKPSKEAGKN